MRTLVFALALSAAPAFAGTSLVLTPLSPYQVLGAQCGAGTSVATATGFAGAYATTYTVASTRCGGSGRGGDRKSTRLNSSHLVISYAVFCLKKKIKQSIRHAYWKSRKHKLNL